MPGEPLTTNAGRSLLDLLHQVTPSGHYSTWIAAIEQEAVTRALRSIREQVEGLRAKSDAATPGPWIRRWASLNVHHMGGDDALQAQADIDFAVAATAFVRDLLDRAILDQAAPREPGQ